MKSIYNFKIKNLIILLSVLLITSCGLKPIAPEYTFVKTNFETVELEKLGQGTILIYNGADILHKVDNTARLNIWINDKALGQLKPSEYVILKLDEGNYKFRALHLDVVNMRSEHDVIIDEKTKVIKIKPNLTSNKLWITNELPIRFEKFKYAMSADKEP